MADGYNQELDVKHKKIQEELRTTKLGTNSLKMD